MRLPRLMTTILYCRFFDCKVDIVHIYLLVVGCDAVLVVVCFVGLADSAVPEKKKKMVIIIGKKCQC